MFFSSRKDPQLKSVGGFAFFLSLFFLLFLSVFIIITLPQLIDEAARKYSFHFGLGLIVGACAAFYLVRGKLSVLLHEYKHSIVSALAGNRAKKLKVQHDSGFFEYEYSKASAEYNAFIALAPYWFPLLTIPATLLGLAIWHSSHLHLVTVLGIGFGADLILNTRDISPRQTDFTGIRGGFWTGLLYVIAMNATIISILAAWVFQGTTGLKVLLYGLWTVVVHIVAYYRGG